MHVFTTNRRIYWTHELKSWGWTIALCILVYLLFKAFTVVPVGRILVPVSLIFLYKLRDTLTQFHVDRIRIDSKGNRLSLLLSSTMSGQRVKDYELHQIKSEVIITHGVLRIFQSHIFLKLLLPKDEVFRITSRYGFSEGTLRMIDSTINQAKLQSSDSAGLNLESIDGKEGMISPY